jgi:branched-chain amino acid transport system substrate-binding protein
LRTRAPRALLAAAAVFVLAACASTVPAPPPPVQAPAAEPLVQEPLPEPGPVQVALLVPLSGPSAGIGQAMLNAAQLALFDAADERFELLPRDTAGTPEGAREAARDALAEGADMILGPLLSASVGAVKPLARASGVPVLAFSSDWTHADAGTWIMGLAPQDQVLRVVGYARAQGLARIGALVPATPYGEAVANALRTSAGRFGSDIVRVERYDAAAPDVTPAMRSLASAGPAAFDAVMIAEGGEKLRTMAPMLSFFEIDPRRVRLLGTGLWDDPATGRESTLAGGWYAAPDPAARADFEQRYAEFYGSPPHRLATLAYDATALAARLARFGDLGPAALTDPSGFIGTDGVFRLLPGGMVERGLAVLEVTRAGPRVIDPAPSSFEPLVQ